VNYKDAYKAIQHIKKSTFKAEPIWPNVKSLTLKQFIILSTLIAENKSLKQTGA